jgi:phage-related protein
MREIRFLGDTEKRIGNFPYLVMLRCLHELDRVRQGLDPSNWKPIKTVAPGVREIRIQAGGAYRILYVTSRPEAIYVLHAFRKNSMQTRKQDIELARKRLQSLS